MPNPFPDPAVGLTAITEPRDGDVMFRDGSFLRIAHTRVATPVCRICGWNGVPRFNDWEAMSDLSLHYRTRMENGPNDPHQPYNNAVHDHGTHHDADGADGRDAHAS